MKIRKYTMIIATETLSPDSIPALLAEVAENIRKETTCGELTKDDGDTIRWTLDIEKQEEI